MRTQRIEDDGRTSPDVWKTAAQQKDERLQDNGDKKRLAHQHPKDLLRLVICERDRWRTAWCHVDSASSFAILNLPRAPRGAHDAHVYTFL